MSNAAPCPAARGFGHGLSEFSTRSRACLQRVRVSCYSSAPSRSRFCWPNKILRELRGFRSRRMTPFVGIPTIRIERHRHAVRLLEYLKELRVHLLHG